MRETNSKKDAIPRRVHLLKGNGVRPAFDESLQTNIQPINLIRFMLYSYIIESEKKKTQFIFLNIVDFRKSLVITLTVTHEIYGKTILKITLHRCCQPFDI